MAIDDNHGKTAAGLVIPEGDPAAAIKAAERLTDPEQALALARQAKNATDPRSVATDVDAALAATDLAAAVAGAKAGRGQGQEAVPLLTVDAAAERAGAGTHNGTVPLTGGAADLVAAGPGRTWAAAGGAVSPAGRAADRRPVGGQRSPGGLWIPGSDGNSRDR